MSWKGSGDFRGGAKPPRPVASGPSASGKGPSSIWDAGSAGGPSVLSLIIACCVVGLVGLGLAVGFAGALGRTGAAPAAAPAAAAATAAPAAPAATAAPAAPAATAAPAAAADIPTEPRGPGLATGSGAALSLGSNGEQLAFDQPSLSVADGVVSLTFKNNSTAVQHNWVLVQGGDDVASAVNDAAAGQVSKARSALAAVPPADTAGLVVATQQLQPGEEVTVTFQTPGPGTYTFLCTFPGHYLAGMQGQLVVN